MIRLKTNNHKKAIIIAPFAAVILAVASFFWFAQNSSADSIKNQTFESQNSNYSTHEQGAWSFSREASILDTRHVQVDYTIKSNLKGNGNKKDVLFMMDTSGSMTTARYGGVVDAIKSVAHNLSDDNTGSKFALATFNTTTLVVSDFTSSYGDFIFSIFDKMPAAVGGTDYYSAIMKIDEMLEGYEPQDDRDLVVIFITDGRPVENDGLQQLAYRELKQKYPFMTVQGLQFELGDEVIPEIAAVSDNQFVSYVDTVEDVLFEAVADGYKYDPFVYLEDINTNYYDIESVTASLGSATVENGRITWDMSELYRSGTKQTMKLKLTVKDACLDTEEARCAISSHTEIHTKLRDAPDENLSTSDSLLIQFKYDVSYDLNAPTDCENAIALPATTKALISSTIEIQDITPVCQGYKFHGWAIANDATYRYNDNYFKMPDSDTVIRAIWSKASVSKSMEGNVAPMTTATFKSVSSACSFGCPGSTFDTQYNAITAAAGGQKKDIKAIKMADSLPIDFTPDEENKTNIFSADDSELPIYGFYDNTTKTLYFYSDADKIYLGARAHLAFSSFANLEDISAMESIDTSNTQDMRDIFANDKKLKDLSPIAHWDLSSTTTLYEAFYATGAENLDALAEWDVSHVTSFEETFEDMDSLTDITGLADWDLASATTLEQMFYDCDSLASLDGLQNWDVRGIKNMHQLFYSMNSLTSLAPLSEWETDSLENLAAAFSYTTALVSLDGIEGWDVSHVTSFNSLFYGDAALSDIDALLDWEVGQVSDFYRTFRDCTALSSLYGLRKWNTASVTTMQEAFYNTRMTSLNGLQNWNVKKLKSLNSAFQDSSNLIDLSALSGWETDSLTDMAYAFQNCSKLQSLNGLQNFYTGKVTTLRATFKNNPLLSDITALNDWDVAKVTTMRELFNKDTSITSLVALSGWITTSLTNLENTFSNMTSLTRLGADAPLKGIDDWDVTHVTTLYGAFQANTSLTDITALSTWRPVATTTMYQLFYNDTALTNLSGLEDWRPSSLANLEGAFRSTSITSLTPLSQWTTPNLQTLEGTFRDTPITSLSGLENWDAGSLTTLRGAFLNTSIANVDSLQAWRPSKLTSMLNTFEGCSSLTDISGLAGWTNLPVLSNMSSAFYGTSISSLHGLENWSTPVLTNLSSAFYNVSTLTDISALATWTSTGSIKNLNSAFYGDTGLTDVSALAGWNVESITNYGYAFYGCDNVSDFSTLDPWANTLNNSASFSRMFNRSSSSIPAAILPSWYTI
ncbi:BspA family leucine-rich repeat surface protein [Candidatus Saccharibacteria bacterium]|nr:BspA family leucine-rich repeat surface protein [Candidatus Saccharibacteria bacterium]